MGKKFAKVPLSARKQLQDLEKEGWTLCAMCLLQDGKNIPTILCVRGNEMKTYAQSFSKENTKTKEDAFESAQNVLDQLKEGMVQEKKTVLGGMTLTDYFIESAPASE